MSNIPEPKFFPRVTWMIVLWSPERREWEPYFGAVPGKDAARKRLKAYREMLPMLDRKFRLVRVESNYQTCPEDDE